MTIARGATNAKAMYSVFSSVGGHQYNSTGVTESLSLVMDSATTDGELTPFSAVQI